MSSYRQILKKSFQLTLRNKILWILGFLAALLGNGGEYNIFFSNLNKISETDITLKTLSSSFSSNFIANSAFVYLKNLITAQQPIISFLILLLLGGLIYLTITAQGALIAIIYKLVKKKYQPRSGSIAVKKRWLKIRGKFWELFFTNLIFKGGGIVLAFLISMPFVILLSSFTNLSIASTVMIAGGLIFTPLIIIVSFLVKYALIFIVVKDQDPISAFASSLKLWQNNWLITVEIAVILFVLNLFIGIIAFIGALILSFPIIAAVALIIHPLALPDGYYFTIIAWILIIILPILGSIFAVFQYGAWTILFAKITSRRRMYSKLARVAANFLEKLP